MYVREEDLLERGKGFSFGRASSDNTPCKNTQRQFMSMWNGLYLESRVGITHGRPQTSSYTSRGQDMSLLGATASPQQQQ